MTTGESSGVDETLISRTGQVNDPIFQSDVSYGSINKSPAVVESHSSLGDDEERASLKPDSGDDSPKPGPGKVATIVSLLLLGPSSHIAYRLAI